MAAWIHRYVGLFLGTWLTLVGLTGTVLVFHKELDSWLNAPLLRVDHTTPKPDLDFLLAKVRERFPDRAVLYYDRYGISDYESYPFILSEPLAMTPNGPDASAIPDQEDAGDLEVFVDPRTGAILGQRPYMTWLRVIHSLHEELLIPTPGRLIVGFVGMIVVVNVVAGVVLWWRQSRRRLVEALKIRPSSPMPRLIREIHTVVGICIALFLGVQALSGSLINTYFPMTRWASAAFGRSASAPARPGPVSAAAGLGAGLITANQARDIGVALHPQSDAVHIVFPVPRKNTYSVRIFPRDQSRTRHLRQATISPTGRTLFVFEADKIAMPHRVPAAYAIWIHNGQFWGIGGRLTVLVVGLALMLFFPTGFYMWRRRRRPRKGAAQRKGQAPVRKGARTAAGAP